MLFEAIKPQLLTLHHEAFNDVQYIFELKYDGFRILLHKDGERIEAYTRQGRCITDKFPEVQRIQQQIHAHTAILDCEGVVFRGGRPVFDDFAYRGRLKQPLRIEQATSTHPATFVAFDVLMSDGKDYTREQLLTRKEHLGKIVEPSNELITTFYVDGEGVDLKRLSEERDWEGIVAKRKHSVYQPNVRSTDWLKIKNWREIDVVILGYRTDPEFGMIVGLNFPTVRNKPVASVQYGFSRDEKLAFLNVAEGLHTGKERGIRGCKMFCVNSQSRMGSSRLGGERYGDGFEGTFATVHQGKEPQVRRRCPVGSTRFICEHDARDFGSGA